MNALFTIVVYQNAVEQCRTYESLVAASEEVGLKRIPLFVWDNSPVAAKPTFDPCFNLVDWRHDPSNPGLVEAYNTAWRAARDISLDWVVFLDQDTCITADYLAQLAMDATKAPDDCVALVPQVVDGSVQRSPVGHWFEFPFSWQTHRGTGPSDQLIYAINSGMVTRIDFLGQIGGYDSAYELDGVDHWFCREVYRRSSRIFVMDCTIEHSISVNDRKQYVAMNRYQSILRAQTQFASSSEKRSTKLFYMVLLLLHAGRQALTRPFQGYAKLAFVEWIHFCTSGFRRP